MSLKILLISFLGIITGIITGFLPGLSINNLIPIFLSITIFSNFELSIFLVSCSISQILSQFFPSIFLGAPNESSSISVLPGHKLLLKGKGYEAYKICLVSCLLSLIFSTILIFLIQSYFQKFYYFIREYVFYLIFFVSVYTILTEKTLTKILKSVLVFSLSGFLGLIVLNSPYPSSNLMFPMLSGFFGISSLIVSLKEKSYLPKQEISEKINIDKKELIKSSLIGTIFGLIVGFLPGVGVSQAAIMAQNILNIYNERSFLATISSINLANEIFSLNSLYLVGNPRSGTSVALQRILKEIDYTTFLILISTIVLVLSISIPILLVVSKKVYKILLKVNYTLLNISIIFFIFLCVYYFTGLFGVAVCVTSTSIGLLPILLKVKRSHCMGCLLFPTMLFFSGYNSVLIGILF
ncbi:MAG: tripartite tricarboxylate transporter permease [Candidatus Aenigmatarchaeota archaeon]